MVEYLLIIISAIFVNNILLSQFLGICPFLGVSNKLSTATGMSMAVCFVITLATVVTFLLNKVLVLCGLEFLQTISFILVIAALVQMVEIVLKKISPALYASLGIFLPLITTNCAVLGVALTVVQKPSGFAAAADGMMNLGEATVYAFATSLGFGLAMVLFAGLREQLALNDVPKAFKGVPIALVTAGILAMAFMGFSGSLPLLSCSGLNNPQPHQAHSCLRGFALVIPLARNAFSQHIQQAQSLTATSPKGHPIYDHKLPLDTIFFSLLLCFSLPTSPFVPSQPNKVFIFISSLSSTIIECHEDREFSVLFADLPQGLSQSLRHSMSSVNLFNQC